LRDERGGGRSVSRDRRDGGSARDGRRGGRDRDRHHRKRSTTPPPPPQKQEEKPEEMNLDLDPEDEEAQMAALMGFKSFDTTKQKKVRGNDVGAIAKNKTTQYRQYM
jgi:hypothetical protein